MEGLKKLKTGEFNALDQIEQPDGSVIITLTKRGDDKTYRFQVKDLYGPDEEVLWEEVKEVK